MGSDCFFWCHQLMIVAGVVPDGRGTNVVMAPLADGSSICGRARSRSGSSAVSSWWSMAGGSTICWGRGLTSDNSCGALQLPCLTVHLTFVSVKESGGSLSRPLSNQLYRSEGLSAVGQLPAACSLRRVGSAAFSALGLL